MDVLEARRSESVFAIASRFVATGKGGGGSGAIVCFVAMSCGNADVRNLKKAA